MVLYLKALHIIFVVTWFAGLFYMPRLMIYATEAQLKEEPAKSILQQQFAIMMKRLWFGITWPSAVITLIFGLTVLWKGGWLENFSMHGWLHIKLLLVFFLYLYHFSLHYIYKQISNGVFRYNSQQLRIWNEVATIFLVAIVMLVVVKQNMSAVYGLFGLILFIIILMSAVKIYKLSREKGKAAG